MTTQIANAEQLVEEEKILLQQIATTEQCMTAVFERVRRSIDKLALEDVVLAIHEVEAVLRIELVHVRLAKFLTSKE